ncbi:hypothetical protein V5799_008094 [Amblyomma americanum]
MEEPAVGHGGNAPGGPPASMPPMAHCVAFCSAFGLVFAVSGALLLTSGLPYRRLQLRIISVFMLAMGAALLTAAIGLTIKWRKWYPLRYTRRRPRHPGQQPALVIRVPTVSGGAYVFTAPSTPPATREASQLPPPAYEDVVRPPPSYESVILMLEKEAEDPLAACASSVLPV